ncbi:hypothetical protein BK821_12270 [Staphylococcus sp. LCT-H4]|nr:hypothetical protein BK821_12270 [Staphylococcus sp. LCT-H4]
MLSKKSEKILKELLQKEKDFEILPESEKELNTSKTSYSEIREMFPLSSHISTAMLVKYLLEEKYIYNHIGGKENTFEIKNLEMGTLKIVIGEKGISYLEHKKYVLMAKTIPLIIAALSFIFSIYTFITS